MRKDWCRFEMVGIREVSNYSSDQFALRARLLQLPMRCHGSYLRGRRYFTLSLPAPDYFRLTDKKLKDSKALEPKPPPMTRPPHPQWMLEISTQLIDEHAAFHCKLQKNRNVVQTLKKIFWMSLPCTSGAECRRPRRISEHAWKRQRGALNSEGHTQS